MFLVSGRTLGAFALLSLSVPLAQAALVYDNGAPDNITGIGITNYRTVDDFSLPGSFNVNAVRFWAVFNNNEPLGQFSGDVSWAIYSDSGGAVGGLVASGSVAGLGMTDTGAGSGSFNAYQIDFNITPVALGAGNYWLELHEGTALDTGDGTETFWATRGNGGNAMTQSVFENFPTDLLPIASYFGCASCDWDFAFQLYGDADTGQVPEPATGWLFGAALVSIALRRRH